MDIQKLLHEIRNEEYRDSRFLHLTANENQMSETARTFLGSKLSERYFFGGGDEENVVTAGGFTGLGMKGVEKLVLEAEDAAKQMLVASVVNLNCLSGVHAMMCAILSTTEPGDVVMTVKKENGGHFATKGILERVGRSHVYADFDYEKLRFEADKIAKTFKDHKVKALYLDVSYYLNPHNLTEIREALGNDAIIIYDASHTMGIIMGQKFQSPLKEGADVICANTHKTLPGPQKGMIAFGDERFGTKANDVINSCLYSSPHTHHMTALATTILELKEFGKEYASQIVDNSNAIAKAFVGLGYEVRKANTGHYSHNHQAHIFIDKKGDPINLYTKLLKNSISTNFDNPLGGRLFIRVGTQELTRRGMKEIEMEKVASLIDKAFKDENVKDEVEKLTLEFNKVHYSFDKI